MTRVLITGTSTRAAAASAVRAGFDVVSVDAFADRDQPQEASVKRVDRYSAAAVVRTASDVRCDAVTYLSSFENHPAAVARLARGRALWGNAPEVLARVRDPREVARGFAARGVRAPDFRLKAEGTGPEAPGRGITSVGVAAAFRREVAWLLKPLASGGGHGVREWRAGMRLPKRSYLQEFIDGKPGSVVFAAAGGQAMLLGVTHQLIGDATFGSEGFRYCGSIMAPADASLIAAAGALASAAAAEFGLVGVNGVDFIDRQSTLVPIEVNPRWCASMELVERATGASLFAFHAAACARGELPAATPRPRAGSFGKAVVFARGAVRMSDTTPWLEDATVADVPHAGERIGAGRPICTIFAEGATVRACREGLARRAAAVYDSLERNVEVLA